MTETRVLVMEYKNIIGASLDKLTFRHDIAGFIYEGEGRHMTNTDFNSKPTAVRLQDDQSRDPLSQGMYYTKDELLAHIANLQAIADTLEDTKEKED